ncbi:ABC transporter permease [Fuerstiella marisgermanici]|uniref:ABC-type transport system involved in multi-copper enzyme maturation, permease component n=1 Tax=Fuerstiella marisgermanici TaxID=1891926 RepID=A0A1P8WK84_9PLAN|nr:ABC transporter permease [Fuerstiella marisgermanici]APZ94469.1 ABC-type transport system involved in multi-copper enzyme maturation, permease component [Fuerstiella marisgermanici]
MFAGPIFAREALTAPRRLRHYLLRSGYVAFLLVLMYTIRQATIGFQDTKFSGDIATYGNFVFGVLALLQLTLGMFFATLFTAANIAQEKDRRTLILLLMTDMRSRELAYGKLLASWLIVGVLVAASVPVFCALRLLGGVTWSQVFWAEAIIVSTTLAAGAWGCFVAFWREKTFQTLAISVIGVVLFVAVAEGLVVLLGAESAIGAWAAYASPYRALFAVLNPLSATTNGIARVSAVESVCVLLALAAGLSLYTVARLRVWNPSQSLRQSAMEQPALDQSATVAEGTTAAAASTPSVEAVPQRKTHRAVWDNPVTWKEIVTRGYGRKVVVIKLAYVLLAGLIGYGILSSSVDRDALVLGMVSPGAAAFLAIGVISLLLINAQAVTSISTERDSNTLDILLATDISAKEFMTGKILGALWNAREMIIVPIALIVWMLVTGRSSLLSVENLIYIVVAYSVLSLFSVMLGLHAGLTYENSRSAIGNSLGTMFFLFVGIFIFMLLLVEARSSFAIQMQSFIVFIGLGSIGLYSSLTHKNPSSALTIAAMMLPFLTFYAITDFLLGGTLGVCFWICVAYGFAAIAMLIPSISDFDVALGRTTHDAG